MIYVFLAQPFQVRIGSDNHGEPQTTQCGTDPMVRGGKATGSCLSGKKMAESAFKKVVFIAKSIARFIVRVYVCLNWKQFNMWL